MIVKTANATYQIVEDRLVRTDANHRLLFDGEALDIVDRLSPVEVGRPMSFMLRDKHGRAFIRHTSPVVAVEEDQ